MQNKPSSEHRQTNGGELDLDTEIDLPVADPTLVGRQKIANVLQGMDRPAILGRFSQCLHEHFRTGIPLPIEGPQDLCRIADVPINDGCDRNLQNQLGFLVQAETIQKLQQLATMWGEALLVFLDEQMAQQRTDTERKTLSTMAEAALLSDNRSPDDDPGILGLMDHDVALLCSSTVTRSADIDVGVRGLIAQRCVPLLRHYRHDSNDRVGKASIAEQLDVLHFLPSFHAHALRGADEARNNYLEEEYIGDRWEVGVACSTARSIAANNPLPLIRYAERLAEQRIAEEERHSTLEYEFLDGSDPDASWSRLPDTPVSLGFPAGEIPEGMTVGKALKPIASDAMGEFDHSGMLRAVHVIADTGIQRLSVNEICKDPRFNPFPEKGEKDLSLVLQHLERPAMRQLIEKDLQIDLKQVSFVSQVHLLRFLINADRQTLDDLRTVLQENPQDASAILTSFLACAQDKALGHAIMNIAAAPGTGKIFHAYAQLAATVTRTAAEIHGMYADVNPSGSLTVEAIRLSLLSTANKGLRDAAEKLKGSIRLSITDGKVFANSLADQLAHHDIRVQQTRALVAALPPDEVSKINLLQLSTVELRSVRAEYVLNNPELKPILDEMIRTVAKNFPRGDAKDFRQRYLHDPQAEVFYSTCADQLLSFFGTTRMPDGTRYLDWFNTSPKSPIRGLGEATAYTVLHRLVREGDWYLVAKPHVRSHEIFARTGFVTFGSTIPGHSTSEGEYQKGEYQHRYLRCRKLASEENDQYAGKQISPGEQSLIQEACPIKDIVADLELRGQPVKVCRVEYAGIDHEDDIAIGSDDDFIFQVVNDLCENHGMIMSAYIPDEHNNHPEWRKQKRQAYYCVFEKSRLTQPASEKLYKSIHAFHQHPADTRLGGQESITE